MKEITTKLSEDDQAIVYRALTCLARETGNSDFCSEVKTLRGRLADEGKGEGEKEEKPTRLFDEHDGWTDYGKQLSERIERAIRPIVDEYVEDNVDLRHAAFIVQDAVSQELLRVSANKAFTEFKRKQA